VLGGFAFIGPLLFKGSSQSGAFTLHRVKLG
jgi:hypothetical protein